MKKIIKYSLLLLALILIFGFIFYKFSYKKTIAVIGAMDVEIQEVLNNLSNSKTIRYNNFEISTGKIGRNRIVLSKSGVGKVNSAITTQFIIDKFNPEYIINLGIAGSLTDKFQAGDIVIADKMVQHDFDLTAFGKPKGFMSSETETNKPTIYYSDEELIQIFKDNFKAENITIGTLATGDIFVNKPVLKEKIHKEFNADAIDMESAAIAQTAMKNKIPIIVLRTISDTKTDTIHNYKKNKLNAANKSALNIVSILNK